MVFVQSLRCHVLCRPFDTLNESEHRGWWKKMAVKEKSPEEPAQPDKDKESGHVGSFTCLKLPTLRKVTSAEKKRRKKRNSVGKKFDNFNVEAKTDKERKRGSSKESKESKVSKMGKDSAEGKGRKLSKDGKKDTANQVHKDLKDTKEGKDRREGKDIQKRKESKDSKEYRGSRSPEVGNRERSNRERERNKKTGKRFSCKRLKNPNLRQIGSSAESNVSMCYNILGLYLKETCRFFSSIACGRPVTDTRFQEMICEMLSIIGCMCRDCCLLMRYILRILFVIK